MTGTFKSHANCFLAEYEFSREHTVFYFCGDRLHPVKDQWGGTQLGPGLAHSEPRTPHKNTPSASFQQGQASACAVSVHVCLQMRLFLSMCPYKAHRHQVWRGFRCWAHPERTLICSAADSVCCHSACFYSAHGHSWRRAHTHTLSIGIDRQTTPKSTLHTLDSFAVEESHWG